MCELSDLGRWLAANELQSDWEAERLRPEPASTTALSSRKCSFEAVSWPIQWFARPLKLLTALKVMNESNVLYTQIECLRKVSCATL